jgi:hypothetical protein
MAKAYCNLLVEHLDRDDSSVESRMQWNRDGREIQIYFRSLLIKAGIWTEKEITND